MQSGKLICDCCRPTCHFLVKWQLAPVAVLASVLYPGSESLECRHSINELLSSVFSINAM
jgi:hypothetical protein